MHTAQNFGPKVNQTYTLEEEHHVVHTIKQEKVRIFHICAKI